MNIPGKIIIAGGSGFLGTALTDVLVKRGHEVVILTRGADHQAGPVRHVHWDGATLGSVAQRFVAPSLEHEAGAALAWHGALTLRRNALPDGRTATWLRIGMQRVTPTGDAFPLRPVGDRTSMLVSLGVTLP